METHKILDAIESKHGYFYNTYLIYAKDKRYNYVVRFFKHCAGVYYCEKHHKHLDEILVSPTWHLKAITPYYDLAKFIEEKLEKGD